ncbi:MAG: glutamine synthetase type III [Phycisphaerales bacterium]|jgi:glutamine synthetase|nr:glutamine synthetase type III [Phycisphaerales bacterium]
MAQGNVRQDAIAAICHGKPIEGVVDYQTRDLTDVFGEHVFNDDAQRERLPVNVYKKLQETIQAGKELDPTIADSVALAMRDWALEHGASHFTHWFQPMTGSTAEKHDSFVTPTASGGVMPKFSGSDLVRGEPDASSFPSGGLRATFEARGYTAWDPSSPAFILDNPNGATLVIPTMFLSWTGEALGKKTPLLRSMDVLSTQAMRVLKVFGNKTAKRVLTTVGAEQEYFLVDSNFYMNRPDLVATGRTLFGAKPPKGQELDDNYFGAINERALSYMAEVEYELLRLGVPIKTRHNEVAPGQYELAPTFETSNLATDHQMMTMDILSTVAAKHGFACLMHEKPFAGINGSGKHNNWSISTDDGENLLNPGDTPHANAQFLLFCAATVRAVHKYAGLLRVSVCGAGNDHRLGANEAPPAIISVFLGGQLSDVFRQLEAGAAESSQTADSIEVGVSMLPKLPRDAGDRNRTSPFAFTGNKFEFRAPGSSQNVSGVNTVLNAAIAESLDFAATRLEADIAAGKDLNLAVQELLTEMVTEFKPVLFDGDNYAAEWHAEAEKRGLPNYRSTVDCVPLITSPESVELFGKYNVFSARELHSRQEILLETYATKISIEAETTSMMAHTMIMPAALKYQTKIATAVNGAKTAGVEDPALQGLLEEAAATAGAFRQAAVDLDTAKNADIDSDDALAYAQYQHSTIIPAMLKLRELGDKVERLVDSEDWTLPTYAEMLFLR